jgi:hypothetical protein
VQKNAHHRGQRHRNAIESRMVGNPYLIALRQSCPLCARNQSLALLRFTTSRHQTSGPRITSESHLTLAAIAEVSINTPGGFPPLVP